MLHDQDVEGLTRRLKAAKTPDEKARLWGELFPKLKRVARNRIAAAGRSQQESATELVNDVFPGLQRALDNPATQFKSRTDFLAYAATAMRRHRAAAARRQMATELLDDDFSMDTASPAMSMAINDALDALTKTMPRAIRAFEFREFGGYSYEEILELMRTEYRTKSLLAADLTMVRKALAKLLRSGS